MSTIFDPEFYPTPKPLAIHMAKMLLDGLDYNTRYDVIDPEAGKGDLLEAVKDVSEDLEFRKYVFNERHSRFCPSFKLRYFAIEKNFELQKILISKDFKFLGEDFLTFNSIRNFDLVIMNPPFSNGVKHLLKAWEFSKGGRIVCALNAETIKNACDSNRQLLVDIIQDNNGTVEYRSEEFVHADRKTNVEVAIVCLNKPASDNYDFSFTGSRVSANFDINLDSLNNQVTRKDEIGNWILALEKCVDSMRELMSKHAEWEFYYNVIGGCNKEEYPIITNIFRMIEASKETFTNAVDELNGMAWDKLFRETDISERLTKGVRETFAEEAKQKGHLAFNLSNVEKVIESLVLSRPKIMNACIVECFDHLTKYYKDNRDHTEGWKTNDSYKVNRRCVIPNSLSQYKTLAPDMNYHTREMIIDLEKCLCYLAGEPVVEYKESLGFVIEHEIEKNQSFGQWHDGHFFKFKFFKKGTLHIEFKDKRLWEWFNEAAAKGKNWIPDECRRSRHQFHEDRKAI